MARRPPALALVQPGSLEEVVHVRSLLASTLPVIRARTANLRQELRAANMLRDQAQVAVASLVSGQEELKKQRVAFARLEARERLRSQSLTGAALFESDRALAFDEEARDLAQQFGTLRYQSQVRRSLSELPGPVARPLVEGKAPDPGPVRAARYLLPVEGRIVAGMGELSDAGVHGRGLTFEARAYTRVIAPANGRIAYAGRFRGYGSILIIDHGKGLTSLITHIGRLNVKAGDMVARGQPIGRTAGSRSRVTVELRRGGTPVAITPLVGAA
jgi:septal ring factor EnvC (AmiA/AmiB activator)